MWIPEYKRAKILKTIIVFIILAGVLVGVNFIYSRIAKETTDIKLMDRKELRYDADGPFIMIDTSKHLIGFYRDTLPVYHDKFNEFIDEGIYTAEYDEYTGMLDIYGGNGNIITSIDISKDEELQHGFNKCPVLVYGG